MSTERSNPISFRKQVLIHRNPSSTAVDKQSNFPLRASCSGPNGDSDSSRFKKFLVLRPSPKGFTVILEEDGFSLELDIISSQNNTKVEAATTEVGNGNDPNSAAAAAGENPPKSTDAAESKKSKDPNSAAAAAENPPKSTDAAESKDPINYSVDSGLVFAGRFFEDNKWFYADYLKEDLLKMIDKMIEQVNWVPVLALIPFHKSTNPFVMKLISMWPFIFFAIKYGHFLSIKASKKKE
ncbi:hypothetical protein L1987_86596 [Smallanthus sonchifolius]|uniref:Uncharacterized protein n=1 Tax=Smallanthus sonchifolius TaxID=185202 RepID=A0ACB8Y094_9ASTR|nr:hypothetical protein L1987_86596 [Smallanthus sonchifolius]